MRSRPSRNAAVYEQFQSWAVTRKLNHLAGEVRFTNDFLEWMMSVLQDKLDQVLADSAAEQTVLDSAITFIMGVPDLVKTAVQAALDAGATPEQLASFDELHTEITGRQAAITTALSTVNPPAGGNDSGGTGGDDGGQDTVTGGGGADTTGGAAS